jgi:hypothetical protein
LKKVVRLRKDLELKGIYHRDEIHPWSIYKNDPHILTPGDKACVWDFKVPGAS